MDSLGISHLSLEEQPQPLSHPLDHGEMGQSVEICGEGETKHGGRWRSSESQESGYMSESEQESQDISSSDTQDGYYSDYGSQDMPMEAVNIATEGPRESYCVDIRNKGNLVVTLGDDGAHTSNRQLALPSKRRNTDSGHGESKIPRLRKKNSNQIVGANSKKQKSIPQYFRKQKRREVVGYKRGDELDKNILSKNIYIDIKENSGSIQISNDASKEDLEDCVTDGRSRNTYHINIMNSSGNMAIGDNAKCEHNFVTGECVTADGLHPNVVVSPTAPLVVRAGKSVAKRTQLIYKLTGDIYPLRENGKWDLFYQCVNQGIKIARDAGQKGVKIFLMIEKSIGLSYQKKNEESLKLLNKANKEISEHALEMREFLLALSHSQLAALYRREKKKLKTYDALAKAQQNAVMVPSFLVKGFTAYERASTLSLELSLVSISEPDRDELKKEAKDALRLAISFCEEMLQQNPGLYLRKHIFALLKLALLDLNCRTSAARSQPVSERDVNEAEDCIKHTEQKYSQHLNDSLKIQLYTAKCDLCFRKAQVQCQENQTDNGHKQLEIELYQQAMVYGEMALKMAQKINFPIDIQALQERLSELRVLSGDATCSRITEL
ncbi:uncharacterized protein LOC116613263 [Nematostella vectensis]|uniref:uncharacterized protein LOC116613263 n=1 Tax=Nematostella vectensis TaxID=45351 RepID=UPI002076DE39|nr:uncharacterized protein LOC116613263 [Nematostella vectensis]